MKKLLVVIISLLLIAVACIYIFIPKQLNVSHSISVKTNDKWAFKYVMNTNEWRKWWPSDRMHQQNTDSLFYHGGLLFTTDSLYYNAVLIPIEKNGVTMNSKLYVMPVRKHEVQLTWECSLDGGYNPFVRWQQYNKAVAVKKSMTGILGAYKKWLEVPENIYGFEVKEGKIIDTMLVAIRTTFKAYPSPDQIDSVMQILRNHAAKNNATVNGYPMLNVLNEVPGIYAAQMALPVNKRVPETAAIRMKRMFGGNTLIATVRGGYYTIAKAYEACEAYKSDHDRTSPAIPFQSMITDRVAEPDTSKWETIIYCPVH